MTTSADIIATTPRASVVGKLVSNHQVPSQVPRHEALSDREYHVMCRLGLGERVKEIALDLSLSVKTISTYRTRILKKMNMKSNADLAQYVLQHGLVDRVEP